MTGKQFLYIVIATFITALIWVATDVIHTKNNVTIPPETQSLMEPINPQLDTSPVDDL